jgi:hypothetical protein
MSGLKKFHASRDEVRRIARKLLAITEVDQSWDLECVVTTLHEVRELADSCNLDIYRQKYGNGLTQGANPASPQPEILSRDQGDRFKELKKQFIVDEIPPIVDCPECARRLRLNAHGKVPEHRKPQRRGERPTGAFCAGSEAVPR